MSSESESARLGDEAETTWRRSPPGGVPIPDAAPVPSTEARGTGLAAGVTRVNESVRGDGLCCETGGDSDGPPTAERDAGFAARSDEAGPQPASPTSSTAIVLKTLAERGDSDSIHGRATIGILVFQDLAVVPMMLLTPILGGQSDGGWQAILLTLGESILVVALVIAGAWYLVPKILGHIVRSRSRELFLLTIIVSRLGIAWLSSLGGLSLALGAFIAELVISESEYSHQAMAEVLPFRDSFNSLFFVSIGILMDWRVLLAHPLPMIGLLVAVLLVKFVARAGAVLLAEVPLRSAIMVGIALAQVGEFSFLLAQQGQESGFLRGDPYQVFLAVSVLSMIVTPFLMQWSPHLARRVEAWQRLRHWLPSRTTAHVLQTEGKQIRVKDHVIIMGYGLNGRNLARVLGETEIPYLALDLDGDTVSREAKHGVPIYYGDGTNPNVLRHMRIEDAKVLVVAISDPFITRRAVQVAKGLNPKLHVVVRTRYLRELEELHQLGADDVVPEEFETSIEIFALVLRTYKLPQAFVTEKANQIRREGYALLRRSELPELAHHLRGGTVAMRQSKPAASTTIRLRRGRHWLRFISVHAPALQ